MAAGEGRLRGSAGAAREAQVELRVAARKAGHAARVLRAAGRQFGRAGEELSLSLVGDAEMRKLNRAFRGKDEATDVLSWEPGEIVISLDTARRQADEGGWPLSVELRRLLAHGIAHCRGHDHVDANSAARMARAERDMLGSDGMVGDAFSSSGGALRGGGSPARTSGGRRPERPGKNSRSQPR